MWYDNTVFLNQVSYLIDIILVCVYGSIVAFYVFTFIL